MRLRGREGLGVCKGVLPTQCSQYPESSGTLGKQRAVRKQLGVMLGKPEREVSMNGGTRAAMGTCEGPLRLEIRGHH